MANSIIQAYRGGYTDFDLTTILRQLHIDLKTQKIVLVGHSQGTFYTNAAYDYLIKNGVDKSAIAVYNIGTPADRVAGNGKYLTSSTDEIINATVRGLANAGFANKPLPANIDIKIPNEPGVNYDNGHSFSKVYLGLAPDRIISDIDYEIKGLVANSDKNECFVQPETGILYNVWDGGYKIIDNMGKVGKYAGTGNTAQVDAAISYLFQGIFNLGKNIGSSFANLFNNHGFLGASLASIPEQNISVDSTFNPDPINNTLFNWPDLLDYNGTGGPEENYIAEQSLQDLLDDIQEKIDLINQQVQNLVAEREQENTQQLEEGKIVDEEDNNNNNNDNNNNGEKLGNGGSYVTYPKILISEVQILPIDQRFIELYNPNDQNISLTGWYLQRKDNNAIAWGSLVSSTNFSGKMIPAKGYFLIARQIPSIDIITDITLTADNSITLKNPNGEISDKLGFGNAMDPEALSTEKPTTNKSIGRKVISLDDFFTEQETDNNLNDFEIDNPTPRAQNIKYIAPPFPPVIENILISEIQTDSLEGVGGTNNDWVELYNPNDTTVSLKGWSIQKHSSSNPCAINSAFKVISFSDNAVISSKGYYLVARSDASQDLLDKADLTSSYLQLSDDNTVYLVKSQDEIIDGNDANIIDKVGYGQSCFADNSSAINPTEAKSIGRKAVDGQEQDTNNNLDDFEIDIPTPRAQNTPYIIPDLVDVIAPQVTFNIGAIQTDLTFPISFTIKDPIVGTVSPSGIGSYVFQWQEEGKDWQSDTSTIVNESPTSADFIRSFTGEDGKTYNFQVKATDVLGNESIWLPETPATTEIKLVPKILINEIQINPTAQRFIELYNPNSVDIDLTGWYLQRKGENDISWGSLISKTLFNGKIIKAHGYFIISRQIVGSNILLPTMTISDNNSLALKNPDEMIVDKVGYGTALDYKVAPAVNPLSGQSIQRRWDTINNKTQDTGDNSIDFQIFHKTTPKAQSPKYYLYNGFTFATNTILKKALGPYLFNGSNSVSAGVTLTIEPGTVMKFADSVLIIDGTLNAVGTTDKIIVFTSINDIDYGGDIRETGNNSPVLPGQWSGILFNQSGVNSNLENVVVRYAGGNTPKYMQAALKVDRTSIILKNSLIDNNINGGAYFYGSNSSIDSVQFANNLATNSSSYYGKGVYADGGSSIEVKNCIFKNNYDALYLINNTAVDIYPIASNNYFEGNHSVISVEGSNIYPDFSENSAKDNFCNAIIFGAAINKNIFVHKDLTYLVEYALNVPENITLTIEPGTVMKFADSMIKVNGTLNAVGTLAEPIVFTSVDDREYGTDVWPWNDTPVSPGQWSGILFNQTSVNSNLENIILRYGGGDLGGYVGGGISVEKSTIILKNSIIQSNILSGLRLVNSASNIDSVQFLNNKLINNGSPVKGLYILGGSPTISNSYFAENDYGMYLDIQYGIMPTPVLENNTFGPFPNPFDPEGVYEVNRIKDYYDASLPKE